MQQWWRHKRGLLATVLGAGALALGPGSAVAAPTDLDLGFGGAGNAGVNAGGLEYARAIVVQPDGKLVAVGETTNGRKTLVFRLTADGRLDPSFGVTGVRTLDSDTFQYSPAVAIQPDGKIVVTGAVGPSYDAVVYRLNRDGSPDPTFNGGGSRVIDSGDQEQATDVAIQPDGRIVVVGATTATNGGDAAVYRLNPDGSFDTTFDGDGALGIDSGGREEAYAVALQADGKAVVAGRTSINKDAAVYRVNPDGSLDKTFDDDGAVGIGLGNENEYFNDVALQPDGRIVLSGATAAGDSDGLLVRMNPDGTLDRSFDGDGIRLVDNSAYEAFNGLAIQPDGRIVAAGTTTLGDDALMVRLEPDGSSDRSFGAGGTFTTSAGGLTEALGMALQPDGRILLVGESDRNDGDAAVVRFRGDSLDPRGGSGAGRGGSGTGGQQEGRPLCMGRRATIVGTTRRDVIRGTRRRDVIVALAGNDAIRGLGRDDLVCGGPGNDVISGGPGNDVISGGPGRDTLRGGAGRDRLIGGPGRDRFIGGPGRDVVGQ